MSYKDSFFSCFFVPKPTLTEKNLPDQTGCVTIITGGYAGVGKELARILYQKNATVYVAGRSKEKAQNAVEEIKSSAPTSDGRLEFLHIDLADLSTIKPAVEAFLQKEQKLNVLVNNAGVMFPPAGQVTTQGHELQMGTNVLGHYLFTQLLTPLLDKTASTAPPNSVRVCWAASLATFISPKNGITWSDETNTPKTLSDPLQNYAQSKTGNIFLAQSYQSQHPNLVSLAFNPGNLHSELGRHQEGSMFVRLGKAILCHPTIYGAHTELWAGWSEEAGQHGGESRYVAPWGRWGLLRSDILGSDAKRKLWEWCERETREFL
ncbi:Hypothetical predicted protein [Lecanosticta acicola]|uniref:Short-chain dehydrogenase n=1 Tax=Lecanosticta acicola TaxID=111012 RepID=A0AAI9EF00_9PEZI|nr:Hypothetical predicted protein [Lecanosticta acicola]